MQETTETYPKNNARHLGALPTQARPVEAFPPQLLERGEKVESVDDLDKFFGCNFQPMEGELVRPKLGRFLLRWHFPTAGLGGWPTAALVEKPGVRHGRVEDVMDFLNRHVAAGLLLHLCSYEKVAAQGRYQRQRQ